MADSSASMSSAIPVPISVTVLPNRRPLATGREPRPESVVRPSFDGQDPSALVNQVPRHQTMPPRVDAITIPGGYVWFGDGIDGISLTAEGRLIRDTAAFSHGYSPLPLDALRARARDIDEDWVTVLDSTWCNHYHLLTLAMPRLVYAQAHLPEAWVALPARRKPAADGRPPMLDQLLALSGEGHRVRQVEDGLYRPRNLHVIWTNLGHPPALHLVDETFACFDILARNVPAVPERRFPKRVFIERVGDTRLPDPTANRSLDRYLASHGFEKVRLETLDMADQIRLFAGATHVVAAHGAGLSNIVFGPPNLRVLELNRDLDGRGTLRPWFLMIAAARGQHYQYLNASACELADLPLGLAFDRLMGTNRQALRMRLTRLRGRLGRLAARLIGGNAGAAGGVSAPPPPSPHPRDNSGARPPGRG